MDPGPEAREPRLLRLRREVVGVTREEVSSLGKRSSVVSYGNRNHQLKTENLELEWMSIAVNCFIQPPYPKMSLPLQTLTISSFLCGHYSQGGEGVLREWRNVPEKAEKKFGKRT
jgi:hypothetical protein